MRGILAEYIVASAVGKVNDYRTEWDAYDIETEEGIKIEVKSDAYLQSWKQKELSRISFSIRPTKGWDSTTDTYSSEVVRQSHVYVFCVLKHTVQETLDPLDMEQWQFFVLGTKKLTASVGNQKSISLSRLESLNPIITSYEELHREIRGLELES